MSRDHEELPAVYEPVRLAVADSAFARAIRRAEAGAEEGTLLRVDAPHSPRAQDGAGWAFRPGDLDAALVLRPDYPATRALELALVATVSLGTAIAELVEPMVGLAYRWPDRVLLGGADAAAVRLAMAAGDPPDWLVLGVTVNVADVELGPERATLNGNGGAACDGDAVLARFCRYFLENINGWAEDGLERTRRSWTRRGLDRGEPITLSLAGEAVSGRAKALDADGALRLETATGERRISLAAFFRGS